MATDKAEMKIYFRNGSSISRANLDGTGVEVFLENADIWHVDFDWITAGRLFWSTWTDERIYVMYLHNKKKVQLTETGIGNRDIAVDPTVG
jgi:hypothetical protein